MGRSLKHLVELVGRLMEQKVGLLSLNDPIDTTSAQGRFVFNLFASLAEFERELIRERTNAGLTAARARLERPTPRVALGLALRGVASAAIDLSDGLIGDLGHILEQSQVGATVQVDGLVQTIACYAEPAQADPLTGLHLSPEQWRTLALAGGDDYELLFTAAPAQRAAVTEAAHNSQTPVHRIGQIETTPGLRLLDAQDQLLPNTYASFDHFA